MYDNYLTINKKFKSSVNLLYDLYDEEKILQYIPTTNLCDIIKKYVNSVLGNTNKSTILSGPYGKGKSYLMLMLTYLFSERKDRTLFNKVLCKIEKVDEELASLIKEMDKRKIVLMPVIINGSSFENINQCFMISLHNSLVEHKINDIIPTTTFQECLSLIDKWEYDFDTEFNIFNKCIATLPITLNELKIGLKNYDMSTYKQFETLFSCISHGYPFNPLINDDIGLIYNDVAREIKKYGYTGIFTIFDEFGVFLDSQTNDFSARLNKIQSFSEKCNSSEEYSQLHLCCITHKDIKLYDKSDRLYKDEFEKIAGRFKEYRFDSSLEENYQIICAALEKNAKYNELVSDKLVEYGTFLDAVVESNIFNSKKQVDYLFKNGYPFNPLSIYSLVAVSEKIAQNERTLFTFISDQDSNSFVHFISNNGTGMLNLPIIYDYFEELIHNNSQYKSIYYKVETLKKYSLKEDERNIFKTIALIKIIDDDVKISSTIEKIALCLGKQKCEVEKNIEKLISKHILKQSVNDNTIDFAVIADSEVNNLINDIIIQKYSNSSVSELLTKFDNNRFYVSNQYNFEKKMVRFCKTIYIESSTLMNLTDLASLFLGVEADGLVINLINNDSTTQSNIKELLNKTQYKNVIVRFSDKNISKNVLDKTKRFFAAKQLSLSSKITASIKNALPVLINDLYEEISKYLNDFYKDSRCFNYYDFKEKNLQKCINLSFSNYFSSTVIFNNEQVNKNQVSVASAKARNVVIDDLLKSENKNFGTTSAEATIKASFIYALENKGNPDIVNEIRNVLINSNGVRIPSNEIVNMLKNAPYGMRNGIISLYIAKAITTLTVSSNSSIDTVILYMDDKEIELTSNNISKLVNEPSKFNLCYTQINKYKLEMTKRLLQIFGCEDSISFSDNIACLTRKIRTTISNYSPIIIKTSEKDNLLGLSNLSIKFKDLFIRHDLNNYEVLFIIMPELVMSEELKYENVPVCVESILDEYESSLNKLYDNIINETIKRFGVQTNSIKSAFDLWKSKYSFINEIIFESQEKNLFNALSKIQFNDRDSINAISYHTVGCTLDDWNNKKKESFFKTLDSMITFVENYKANSSILKSSFNASEEDINLSSLGKTLYTNILDSLEEYGDSISNVEKANVLKKILCEILN